ncbi:hypothetical protein A6R68_09654 [Neotoma lepida]|uniref:PABC domain-containing protein n=1 Tax=Neotoma lepida TaxID=56216 RepID=A0A1A6FZ82_NEOLE|nr:hypothetical protein A6R68_09654 [Neotoma lepida]
MHSNLAGKIKGMLTEIDSSELLHMLESPESPGSKVDEAVTVLQAHHVKKEAAQKIFSLITSTIFIRSDISSSPFYDIKVVSLISLVNDMLVSFDYLFKYGIKNLRKLLLIKVFEK